MKQKVWYYNPILRILRRSNCTEERAAELMNIHTLPYLIYFVEEV
jgi:hypothetical protein